MWFVQNVCVFGERVVIYDMIMIYDLTSCQFTPVNVWWVPPYWFLDPRSLWILIHFVCSMWRLESFGCVLISMCFLLRKYSSDRPPDGFPCLITDSIFCNAMNEWMTVFYQFCLYCDRQFCRFGRWLPFDDAFVFVNMYFDAVQIFKFTQNTQCKQSMSFVDFYQWIVNEYVRYDKTLMSWNTRFIEGRFDFG